MLKINQFFDGRVKSISVRSDPLPATIGVMTPGEYGFGTDSKERMTVISGEMRVYFPAEDIWQTFTQGQCFEIEARSRFRVHVDTDVAFYCQYWR